MNWRRLLRREGQEASLAKELSFHIEERVADVMRWGVSEEEARRRVRLEFGGAEQVKDDCRDARRARWVEVLSQDVRYAWRDLCRNPGFAAVAIATLALGIGGITAMFSAFDTILLRPLPYADADRLVMIWDDMSKSEGNPTFFSTPAEWTQWRRLNTVFTDIACSQPGNAILSGDGEPEEVRARKVTWNLWSVLSVQPAMGRVFTEDEDNNGARVAVISHGLWQRRFGGASDIVGRKISINDAPYEVAGVMPRGFYFMPSHDIDMWMPASFPPGLRNNFTWHEAQIVARIKAGVSLGHARESMAALSLQVTAKDFRGPHSATMIPLRQQMAGKTETALIVLLSASAALLLIACVNLANLLLSRGAVGGREVAVRAALGAGRGRLIA
jgi:putative ABC transport system permease protein